nr:TIGR03943 family protein [Amycolatopsis jiangsuensis]
MPDSQGSPAAGHPAHSAGDEHGHHHAARSAWLLVVPVLAVFLVAPPALGADSVTRTVARVPQSAATTAASAFPPLPAGSVVPMAMNEFVSRAGWDSNGTLNGRTVGISGFVVHTGGRTLLARLVISCCAADASPVTVRLKGGGADRFPSDTWLRVTGQVVPGTADATNSYTPDLVPATVERITAPKDPYEY